jgi:hypothetical protein
MCAQTHRAHVVAATADGIRRRNRQRGRAPRGLQTSADADTTALPISDRKNDANAGAQFHSNSGRLSPGRSTEDDAICQSSGKNRRFGSSRRMRISAAGSRRDRVEDPKGTSDCETGGDIQCRRRGVDEGGCRHYHPVNAANPVRVAEQDVVTLPSTNTFPSTAAAERGYRGRRRPLDRPRSSAAPRAVGFTEARGSTALTGLACGHARPTRQGRPRRLPLAGLRILGCGDRRCPGDFERLGRRIDPACHRDANGSSDVTPGRAG